jgi:hypothetical protein
VTLTPGQKYSVFAVGTDRAGNVENKTYPDAAIATPNITQTSTASTQTASTTSSANPPSGSILPLIATVAVLVAIGLVAGVFFIKRRKRF